jgi:hypothetical protein
MVSVITEILKETLTVILQYEIPNNYNKYAYSTSVWAG